MNFFKQNLLFVLIVLFISGCSAIVEKIIPGFSAAEPIKEVNLENEKLDIKTDTIAHTEYVDHSNVTKATSEKVIKDIPIQNLIYEDLSIPDPPIQPVCDGEKITKHWRNLKKVVVVSDSLNIRNNYGSNQNVIGTANRCDQLTVIDKRVEKIQGKKRIRTRGWLKIKTQSGLTGWVASWHTRHIDN
ncbi:conserved hypothetical protein, secreted [Candidatus Magnetomorum sp. HK-1]|nr:conserved hypothetical protein, secreted [Candidatus Magnetomorum sp. HK-1]